MLGLAVALMILASILWIEANERRAVLGPARSSGIVRLGLKLAGWFAAAAGLYLIAAGSGWERGIPIALAWFMGAGVLSLLFAARYQGKHWRLVWPAAGLAAVSSAAFAFGGAA
ncbi:MAG: hypothetical protein AAF830_09420 [Pseudomonadota bacterium]